MCGIAGIFNQGGEPVALDALRRMQNAMRLRGPDGEGFWHDPVVGVGLAHRRLSIIDLSDAGAQPMQLPSGRAIVVFNGEIYNYPELRAWCEAQGAKFRSASDTEVILHLYELQGISFVSRLRGMFAFGLWDTVTQTLTLARDPFGIKPLYYAEIGKSFLFASQVKALLQGGVSQEKDSAGIVSFLLWGYVTEPNTIYRHIRALPAGCIAVLRAQGGVAISKYCDPLDALRGAGPAEAEVGSLREAVADSVRHHLLADVPVGLFLSAGIDSTTLCALMHECMGPIRVRTVTLGFKEYAGGPKDEVPLSQAVARHYDCDSVVEDFGPEDFAAELDHLVSAMDSPSVDGINTYFVSKLAARSGLKVAFSGVGGDELFGGYPSFRQVPELARMLGSMPKSLGRPLRVVLAPILKQLSLHKYGGLLEYGGTIGGAYMLRRGLFMPWEISEIVGDEMAAEGLAELDVLTKLDGLVGGIEAPYDKVMALEHAVYMKNCLLRDADWAGMAHSVEIRTPFVDATLFAQLMALRRRKKVAPFSKQDLFDTPIANLPKEILGRKKSNFDVPMKQWLTHGQNARQAFPIGSDRRSWSKFILQKFQVELATGGR